MALVPEMKLQSLYIIAATVYTPITHTTYREVPMTLVKSHTDGAAMNSKQL